MCHLTIYTGGSDHVAQSARVTGVESSISDSRSENDFVFLTRAATADKVRMLVSVNDHALSDLNRADVAVSDDSFVLVPRLELRRWVGEQVIARSLHRHGRVTTAGEYSKDGQPWRAQSRETL